MSNEHMLKANKQKTVLFCLPMKKWKVTNNVLARCVPATFHC